MIDTCKCTGDKALRGYWGMGRDGACTECHLFKRHLGGHVLTGVGPTPRTVQQVYAAIGNYGGGGEYDLKALRMDLGRLRRQGDIDSRFDDTGHLVWWKVGSDR